MRIPQPIPFDREAIYRHIETVHRLARKIEGLLPLAIFGENPDTRHKIKVVQHFRVGDVDGMADAAFAFEKQPHANVYMPLAVFRSDLARGQKGNEAGVAAVLGVVIDCDADKGEDVHAPVEPNYTIESSAIPAPNRQEFLFFGQPLSPAEAKALAVDLHRKVGGDSGTADICHVWRVAGTANWPNAAKVHSRNRPREPQPVRVIKPWDGSLTDVAELRTTLARLDDTIPLRPKRSAKGNGARTPDQHRAHIDFDRVIREGVPEGEDRSAAFHAVVWHLAATGLSPEQIVATLAKHPGGIAAKFFDRLANEVHRSFQKFDQANARKRLNGVALADFQAFMPTHQYIFAPTGQPWPATSVNARIPPIPLRDENGGPILGNDGKPVTIRASEWLDRFQAVEQMTWCPGRPMLIRDRLVVDGGWIEKAGVTTFNLYRPPTIEPRNPDGAGPWLDHIRRVYPDHADHLIAWFAHRVQRPQEKINHALVLGGAQGIGKDSILEAVKRAVGPWNFAEVSPQQMIGRFNGFLKSVILRLSEARDLGDVNRFQFYDHTKTILAAPPDVLRVDEKHLREHAIINVVGVVITTNHKADGFFLPADDRRHYVAWSEAKREDFDQEYWKRLWSWYDSGGDRDVAAYLGAYDLSHFDAKAPPEKTEAFWEIVDSGRSPEDAEMADIIDKLGSPAATTIAKIATAASGDFAEWLMDRRNRRVIPHRLEQCGYTAVRNDNAQDGQWKISGRRQTIYARRDLPQRERLQAATRLTLTT